MKFHILHLSDLHISKNSTVEQKNLLDKLLDDIKSLQTSNPIEAVVITGDLIDKGNKENWEEVVIFINRLKELLSISDSSFFIVPGNHDIPRGKVYSGIREYAQDTSVKDENADEIIDNRLKNYYLFLEKINYPIENMKCGFQVRSLEINNQKIWINMLNSSWSSLGNDDYQQLAIGKQYLDYNVSYMKNRGQDDLVITIMHHTFEWFTSEEQKLLKEYMKDDYFFNSPILLHGHIHSTDIHSEETPSGKILSLVSGIGYPQKNELTGVRQKMSDCKYAIYNIDTEQKSIECICRKSITSGKFVPDVEIYNGSETGHYKMNYGLPHRSTCTQNKQNDTEEQLHQISTPLVLDNVPMVKDWAGRNEYLELLGKSDYHLFFISGVGGQGKTALAARYFNTESEKQNFYQRIWIDCREIEGTIHTKILDFMNLVSGEDYDSQIYREEAFKDTLKRFLKEIAKHKYLIVFDNVDAYINIEMQEFAEELQELVDSFLEVKSDSTIIFTCRVHIDNTSSSYRGIKLDGLKDDEGLLFFQKRNIDLTSEEDKAACRKIVSLTKGHPWWLGLIAGQMISNRLSPTKYLNEYREDLNTTNSGLQKFFANIWNQLNEMEIDIIIYLAESSKPLSQDELSRLLDNSFSKVGKKIRKLINIGLIIEHRENNKFSVHPLVQQFINKKYSYDDIQDYIINLLENLMGHQAYNNLFGEEFTEKNLPNDFIDSEIIADAIEICLNSEDNTSALHILACYYSILNENKCVAQIISLGERVLKAVDWKVEKITEIKYKAMFLSNYLDLLAIQDVTKEKVIPYLNKYEHYCPNGSIPYTCFLSTAAYIYWRLDMFDKAHYYLKQYEDLSNKYSEDWTISDIFNLKGMILRDQGFYDEAIQVFNEQLDNPVKYGNLSRCYQKMKDYDKALFYLAKSIQKLYEMSSLTNEINLGYAFFWVAEIYNTLDNKCKAKSFLIMSQQRWKEYAPYLLSKTYQLMQELNSIDMYTSKDMEETLIDELFKKYLVEID